MAEENPFNPHLIIPVGTQERSALGEEDVSFYRGEYEGLRTALEDAYRASALPEAPGCRAALDSLLKRLRLDPAGSNHRQDSLTR